MWKLQGKRILSALLCTCMLAGSDGIPVRAASADTGSVSGNEAAAQESEAETVTANELTYKPYEEAKYELTYTVYAGGLTITGYTGTAEGELLIPGSIDGILVVGIGNIAFNNCSGFIGNLILPDSLSFIGYDAFRGCSGFTGDLIFPDNLFSIGSYAFYNCSGFNGNLVLPDNLTSLGHVVFEGCNNFIGNLMLPSNLSSIGDRAFLGCNGFTGDLILPNRLSSVGDSAFSSCNGFNGKLILPDGLLSIGYEAFFGCNGFIGDLALPSTLSSIGNRAFYRCSGFNGKLVLPNSLSSIGYQAFLGCSGFTGDLVFPDSLSSIGYEAFSGCSSFNGKLILPNSLSSIGNRAFYRCSGFTGDLVFPDSLSSIGYEAFSGCSSFNGKLILPNSLFSIGYSAFSGCCGFTGDLVLPDSLSSIGYEAFSGCSGFTGDLVFPINLSTIEKRTFSGCSGFKGNLVLPNSVSSIKSQAFSLCSGFTGNLLFPDSLSTIEYGAFSFCSGFTGDLLLPNSLSSIGDEVFCYCKGFTGNLLLPDNLSSIGNQAFYGCNGFTGNLVFPDSLSSIGYQAFSGCNGFTGNLVLPDSLSSIGWSIFSDCSGFTGNLVLPDSLSSIGSSAFSGCSGFTGELIFPDSLSSIGDWAFGDCIGFTGDLVFPDTLSSIGYCAFADCSGFTGNIFVPSSVTAIDSMAFHFSFNKPNNPITIHAPKGSYGETYALEQGYTYKEWNGFEIGGNPLPGQFEQELFVPEDEYWILVMDETAAPITDAVLTADANGAEVPFIYENGILKLKATDTSVYVTAKKEGKQVWFSYFSPKGGQSGYIKLLDSTPDAMITSVILEEQSIDLLLKSFAVAKKNGSGQSHTLTVNVAGGEPDTYQLLQGNRVLTESTTNQITVNLAEKLTADGGDIKVAATKNGTTLCRKKINLEIIAEGWSEEKEESSIELGSKLTLKVGEDSIPFFANSELEIDTMVKAPIRLVMEENKVKFYIGDAYDLLDEGKNSGLAELESKLKKEWRKSNISSSFQKGVIAGFDVSINAAGYGEGTIDPQTNTVTTKAGIYVKFSCSNGITWYTFIGPIPVYAKITGELENETYGTLDLVIQDGKLLNNSVNLDNTISLKLGMGAGVGLNDIVCVDLEGSGNLSWEHKGSSNIADPEKNKDTVTLQAFLKARAVLLFLSYEKEWPSDKWQIYPSSKQTDKSTWEQPDIYQADAYQLLTREYLLENNAGTQESDVPVLETAGQQTHVVVNGLYPDAKPQLVSYNGITYLFYLDDMAERSDENRTALVYRTETPEGWSKPLTVMDDNTADFDFEVCAGTDGIYAVWQNAAKSMTGISTLEAAAACLELQAAKINGNQIILLEKPDTTEGLAPIAPSLVCHEGNIWAGWFENMENNLLQNGSGKNLFYVQSLQTTGNGERQTLGETELAVTTVDFGFLEGTLHGAFTGDTDGDLSTVSDREIYLLQNGTTKVLTKNEILDSNPQFGSIGNLQTLIYYTDGNLMSTTDARAFTALLPEKNSTLSDAFLFTGSSEAPVIIWKEAYIMGEAAGQALTLIHYDNGSWTAPAQAAATEDSLVAFSAVEDSSGNAIARVVYTARGEYEGKEITRLYETTAGEIGTADIIRLVYEENAFTPGREFPITVTLGNESSYAVQDCELRIVNGSGTPIFSQKTDSVLMSGAEAAVTVTGFVPEDSGDLQTYCLQIYADGILCDTHEFTLGGADYELSSEITYDEGEEILNLRIHNQTGFPGSVKLSIRSENGDTVLLEKEYAELPGGSSINYKCKPNRFWEQTQENRLAITVESTGRQEQSILNNEILLYRPAGQIPVTVTLHQKTVQLKPGETLQFTADVLPADSADKSLFWTSNFPECAEVNEAGLLKANAPGTATVTVSTCDGLTDTCIVEVTESVIPEPEITLGDVPQDSWKYEPALYVYKRGVMTGKGFDGDGNVIFAPDEPLTREQFAQVLYSAEGKENVTYTTRFHDVSDGQWYTNAVLWAADKDIVSGYEGGRYGVGDPITREQLAAMLYKYAQYKGYDISAREAFDRFTDADQVSGWAVNQLQWAVANGVMSGKGETLDPLGSATRAECAAMLRTFLVKFE